VSLLEWGGVREKERGVEWKVKGKKEGKGGEEGRQEGKVICRQLILTFQACKLEGDEAAMQ